MKYSKNTVIFDLDGTLLNTLGDLHAGFNFALKNYGYKERTIEEIRGFIGSGIKKAIELALPYRVDEQEFNKIVECFKDYYKKNMYTYTKPYDGIIDMLQILKQNKYKIAIVSNKFDSAVKELNKKYFAEFIEVAIGESAGIKRKPSSDGIMKALLELNSALENTIYTGDSDIDIQTARNAKIPCISVLWGYKDKEFLAKNGAECFAQTPYDIIKILENN